MDEEQLKKESLELAARKAEFEKERLEYSRSKKISITVIVSAAAVIISGLQVWISIEQRRLSEAQTVQQYIPHLFDPERRDVAFRALRKYIGEESLIELAGEYRATRTLKTLAASDDKWIQQQANKIISEVDAQREALTEKLFSENKAERIEAASEILSNWGWDEQLVPKLLTFASDNLSNHNGVYNTLVILNGLPKLNLMANARQLSEFLSTLSGDEQIGPKTKELVGKVKSRIEP
jgi:hypothetical protein